MLAEPRFRNYPPPATTRRGYAMVPRDNSGLNELSVTIGKLLGGVETLTKTASEDRVSAAQYRTDMRREMKEQSGTLHTITGEVRGLKDNVSTMRGDIDALQRDVSDYRTKRDQAVGAAKLGKMLWAILIAVAGLVGAAASAFINSLIGGGVR